MSTATIDRIGAESYRAGVQHVLEALLENGTLQADAAASIADAHGARAYGATLRQQSYAARNVPALTGEVLEAAPERCASPDCDMPLTRDAEGLDMYDDPAPFRNGQHASCYVPTKAEMQAAGNWPTAENWNTFEVAAPGTRRVGA